MSNFTNKFKTIFSSLFSYHPKDDYNFTIAETPNNNNLNLSSEEDLSQTIFNTIDKNLEFMKIRYNSMINSDIVIREFTLNARNKQFSAFIFYIDGMVDQQLVNDFVLNPLMLKNIANSYDGEENKIVSEITTNNVRIRKVKKFNITDYIDSCLIPQNSVKKETKFSSIISRNKFR